LTLRTDLAKQSAAVKNIASVLNSVRDYNREEADWSATYYVNIAVIASLRLGNAEQAKAILLRGLQLEPDSEQLWHLSRIMVHEGILKAAEVPKIVANN
jgi:hypothetical protein